LDLAIGEVQCKSDLIFSIKTFLSLKKKSASHIGEKVHELSNEYDQEILMWCKEEILDDGRKLTEVINETHENVKYLPGTKIPDNVIAVSDLGQSVKNADILIFVIPHQFVKQTCEQLKDKIKPNAFALTLIKVRIRLGKLISRMIV
jgi:glycerol-3-phosphate dehydrogenase (NAD+)